MEIALNFETGQARVNRAGTVSTIDTTTEDGRTELQVAIQQLSDAVAVQIWNLLTAPKPAPTSEFVEA